MPQTTTIPKVQDVLTEFYQQSPDAIVIINEQRLVLGMNPAAERLTGCAAAEVAGRTHCPQLFRCHDGNGVCYYAGKQLFASGARRQRAYYQLVRSDGKDVRVVADYEMLPVTQGRQRVAKITMQPVEVLESDWLNERRRCKGWSRAMAAMIAILVILSVAKHLTARQPHKGTWVAVGDWKQLHIGTPTAMRVGRSIFYATLRVGEPLSVVSGSCPVDGMTVQWHAKRKQFVCPRDSSAFSVEGAVVGGPASEPLSQPKWKWQGATLFIQLPKR